ncbi:hypothetical protein [Sphingosinithalassobacter sp. CS137]|uniref:hypothetical protein n=1 Tax=Sphingosinithalassobacter sp. CS137 TaxID=2762748 RepID=UPI00165E25C0|nr:hypothetical protein [Sphingosinithalassobacter sp. CS137]
MRLLPPLLTAAAALAACSGQSSDPQPRATPGAMPTAEASPGPVQAQRTGDAWVDYRNARFDFAIEVPPGFVATDPPANDDGRVFRNGDATLRVFGSNNALGRGFEQQVAAVREGLQDVSVVNDGVAVWRATGTNADGARVHVLLLRPDDQRLVTARFSHPSRPGSPWEQTAGRALDSMMLVGRAGPASFLYDPERHALVDTEVQLPPSYEETLDATKLIRRDRTAQLGQRNCSYGESGLTQRCEARMEPGLAIAISDTPVATFRSRFPSGRIEEADLAGRSGFRITQGAEGSGSSWTFLPAGDRTLIVERLWRHQGGEPTTAMMGVLRTLQIEPDPVVAR